jgi:hypothetical protein
MYMGRLGLPFLMNMLYWFKYSSSLEVTEMLVLSLAAKDEADRVFLSCAQTSVFDNRLADYVWMLVCGAAFLLVSQLLPMRILPIWLLHRPFCEAHSQPASFRFPAISSASPFWAPV